MATPTLAVLLGHLPDAIRAEALNVSLLVRCILKVIYLCGFGAAAVLYFAMLGWKGMAVRRGC